MILCLDLETTGLNEQACGLVGIGACWLHSRETFYRRCSPPLDSVIEPQALEVNGIAAGDVQGHLGENLAVMEFVGWVRGNEGGNAKVQIAAWNAHFDHRHLCAAMTRAMVPEKFRPFAHRMIDVHSVLATDKMREVVSGLKQDEVPSYLRGFGGEVANCDDASNMLRLEPEMKPHCALTGAKQVRAMLRRLLGDIGALP